MTKYQDSARQAVQDIVRDGMTVAVGGSGLSGNPFGLIDALRDSGAKEWSNALKQLTAVIIRPPRCFHNWPRR